MGEPRSTRPITVDTIGSGCDVGLDVTQQGITSLARLPTFGTYAPLPKHSSVQIDTVPPHLTAQMLQEGLIPVEGVQRFMQYYTTIAPHGLAKGVPMPQCARSGKATGSHEVMPAPPTCGWESLFVFYYDGMEYLGSWARGSSTFATVPVAMAMDGFVGLCLDFYQAMEQKQVFLGPILALWSHSMWFGGECGYYNAQRQVGARWNTTFTLGQQETTTLGAHLPISAPKFEAARRQPQIQFTASEVRTIRDNLGLGADTEAIRVSTRRNAQRGWATVVGLNLLSWIRFLCRIDYTSTCDTTYATWMDGVSARLLSMDGSHPLMAWLRTSWRALRGVQRLHIPDLAHPECLAPGDELTVKLGTRSGWLGSLGLHYFFGGVHDADVSEATVTLQRPVSSTAVPLSEKTADLPPVAHDAADKPGQRMSQGADDTLHIRVSLRQLFSRRWFFTVPGGLGYDQGGHLPKESIFSLSVPLNAVAWQNTLTHYRNFAARLETATTSAQKRQAVFDLAAAVGTHVAQEEIDGQVQSSELGVRVGLLPSNWWTAWMPQGFSWGLAAHQRHIHLVHQDNPIVAGVPHKRSRDYFVEETQRLLGPDGEHITDAIAMIERTCSPDGIMRGSLLLAARIHRSRADQSEVERDIVAPLRAAYVTHAVSSQNEASTAAQRTAVAALEGAGWRVGREASFEQRILPGELRALCRCEAAILQAAAQAAGSDRHSLVTLRDAVVHSTGANGTPPVSVAQLTDAEVLQAFMVHLPKYLRTTGLSGPAAVYRALAQCGPQQVLAPLRLGVRSACDAYARPGALADVLTMRYQDAGPNQIAAMQAEVAAAQNEILAIEANLLAHDVFLDEAQKQAQYDIFAHHKTRLSALYTQTPRDNLTVAQQEWCLAARNMLCTAGVPGIQQGAAAAGVWQRSLAALLQKGEALGLACATEQRVAWLYARLTAWTAGRRLV